MSEAIRLTQYSHGGRLRLQDFAQGTGGDPRRQRRAEPRSEALGRQRLARRRGCLRPRRGARGGLHHRFLHADRRRPLRLRPYRRDQRHQRYLRHGRRPADGHRHPRLAGQRAGRGSRPRGDRRRPQGLRGSRHPAGRRTLHRRPRADLRPGRDRRGGEALHETQRHRRGRLQAVPDQAAGHRHPHHCREEGQAARRGRRRGA